MLKAKDTIHKAKNQPLAQHYARGWFAIFF